MPNDIANNMADTIHQLEKELKDLREENKVLISERRILMTNAERIKQAEEMISKANAMIEEANKIITEVKEEPDVLAEYKKYFGKGGKLYFLGPSGQINTLDNELDYDHWCGESDPYVNYLVRAYAEIASKLSQFNNKLLAFKWCYDRDYKPNWDDIHSMDGSDAKFYVYFDSTDYKYHYGYCHTTNYNNVFFSSQEIAQKCCDWLNNEHKNGGNT